MMTELSVELYTFDGLLCGLVKGFFDGRSRGYIGRTGMKEWSEPELLHNEEPFYTVITGGPLYDALQLARSKGNPQFLSQEGWKELMDEISIMRDSDMACKWIYEGER